MIVYTELQYALLFIKLFYNIVTYRMLAYGGVFKQLRLQDTDTPKSFRRRFDATAKYVSRLFLLETK